jgi:hypothetical protein
MDEKQEKTAQFLALVAGLCRLCGAEVPRQAEPVDGPIWVSVSIDGAPLCLTYFPTTDADHLVVETELCRPAPGQELEVLRLALEVNLMLARNRHMTLGRHPQTEALLLMACLPLDRVSPESLLTSMALMAEQRAEWVSGRVLQAPPTTAMPKPGMDLPAPTVPNWVE